MGCHKVWSYRSKLGPSVFNEPEAGCEDIPLITLLVLLKPYSVIVSSQALQKLEEFRGEVRPAGLRAQIHQYLLSDFVLLSSAHSDPSSFISGRISVRLKSQEKT